MNPRTVKVNWKHEQIDNKTKLFIKNVTNLDLRRSNNKRMFKAGAAKRKQSEKILKIKIRMAKEMKAINLNYSSW